MNHFRVSTACLLSILATLASTADARAQLVAIPYEAARVREAAAAIKREIRTPSHTEEALAGPLQFIAASLSSLQDLNAVPDDVLDAVVSMAGSGRMASDILIRFDDRAAKALIQSARTSSPRPLYRGGAMLVLQEMLLRRTAGHQLSVDSTARVRTLVRDSFKDKGLGSVELAALGCLAVATADPELRAAAERLTDPATLTSRGVPVASQSRVIARVRRALDTFPKPPATDRERLER